MGNRNLLIVGAGVYGVVAAEIASDMKCFDRIDFIDDFRTTSADGKRVIGNLEKLEELSSSYGKIVVAIGSASKRRENIEKIENNTSLEIVSLISPRAYVSPASKIEKGCIIEPMAVIHTNCVISKGCIVSAGAVINHFSKCLEYVHIDCNATIEGGSVVPSEMKVPSGEVFK